MIHSVYIIGFIFEDAAFQLCRCLSRGNCMTNSPKTHKLHFLFAVISDVLIVSLHPMGCAESQKFIKPLHLLSPDSNYFVIWEYSAVFLAALLKS